MPGRCTLLVGREACLVGAPSVLHSLGEWWQLCAECSLFSHGEGDPVAKSVPGSPMVGRECCITVTVSSLGGWGEGNSVEHSFLLWVGEWLTVLNIPSCSGWERGQC